MARKERTALNNFDTDMDLNFDFDSFDDLYQEPKADNRSPVTKVGGGIVKGAFKALTSLGLVKKVILKALPKEYGEIDRAFSTGISTAKDLYNQSLKEIDPAFKDFAKSAKRALPAIGKELPGKLGSKLTQLGEKLPSGDNGIRPTSPDELKELAIQTQVTAAMGQQAQQQLAQQQLAQTALGNKLSGLQHGESVKYLNAIRISTQNLDNYNSQVNINYQRKSLEIQLRMLSIQAEVLNDNRRFAAEQMQRMDAIVRNTAMPEFVKLKASERFGEAIRNRFIGKSLDNVANRSRDFVNKFGQNLKTALSDKLSRIKDSFEAGTMAMESIADNAEMMEGMKDIGGGSMLDMISEMVGGAGAEALAKRAGTWVGKRPGFKNNKYIQKGTYFASEGSRALRDIPGALDAFRESTAGDNLPFVRALKDLIPSGSPDTSLSRLKVADLQGNAIYTARTDKTINKVIPELLARQLRELTMFRTGRTDVQLVTYDHFKDDFVSKSEMTQTVFDKVINKNTKANIGINKQKMEDYLFDEGSDISKEAKDKFFNLILEDALHQRSSDTGRYANADTYMQAGIHGDDIEKLVTLFRSKFGYNEKGQATRQKSFSDKRRKFQELYLDSSGQFDHQQAALQTLINAGYTDELKAAGLLDESNNLNKRQMYDYMTGAEFSAAGITARPDYEGIGNRRKSGRKAGRAIRSWGERDLDSKQATAQSQANSRNYVSHGNYQDTSDSDRIVDAIRDSNIKAIAQSQAETLQRIELIMLEKEFGGGQPGMFDKIGSYSEKVKTWFNSKLSKWSDKFEGTRKFLTSTKHRAESMWDLIKNWSSVIFNKGKEWGSNAFRWGADIAKRGSKYAWDKTTSAAKSAYEFGRDTALPTAKDWGGRAGSWTMNQAGKTAGRMSRAADWIGDKFNTMRDGMRGEDTSGEGGIGRLFGSLGHGLGWLAGNGIDAAKSMSQRLFGGGVLGRNTQKMVDILEEIRDLLDKRLPGGTFDKDGDGLTEGSWQDQFADRATAEKEAKAAANTQSQSEGKNGGLLASLAGALGFGKNKKGESEASDESGDTIIGGVDLGGDSDKKGKGKKGGRGKGLWGKTKQFGKNLLSNPLTTIASAAWGATKGLGKGAWWLARNAATRVAWPLAKVVLGVLGAKPLLIAAAVAGAGYLAYKGYKALTNFRLGDMSSIRYQQYGFLPSDEAHLQQVMDLETKILKFVKSGDGGQLTIDDSTIETSEIVKDFGLDPSSRSDVGNFIRWYQERFKPVYLTWLTAIKSSSAKNISGADSLSAKDKLELLKLVSFPDGPFGLDISPFKDLKSLPATRNTIANAIKVLRATLEKSAQTDTKTSSITETSAAVAATSVAAVQSTSSKKNDVSTSKNPVLSAAIAGGTNATANVVNAGGGVILRPSGSDNVIDLRSRTLSPIESIRMRIYGLNDADSIRVGAILKLESLVLNQTTTEGKMVVWKGDIFNLANEVAGLFQFSGLNSDLGESWSRWFTRRFIPTYLTYLTGVFRINGSFKRDGDQGKMTPADTVNLANEMSASTYNGTSVWQFADSPFRDYTLGVSPESITAFINVIARSARQGNALKEDAIKHMNTNDATKTSERAKDGSLPVSSAQSSPSYFSKASSWIGNAVDTVTGAMGSAVRGIGSAAASAGRKIGEMIGFGGGDASVTAGFGGKYSELPDPKPGGGYQAFRDLIEAAAKMVGVNPSLLAVICAIESGFKPAVKAATSSATGLFQFIKSTWQSILAKFGKLFGLTLAASPSDPKAATLMGAQFLKNNIEYLQKALGRKVTFVEAYMAHFLGAGGAARVLKYSMDTVLAPLMPDAAAANRGIFYDRSGRAKTLGEIYSDFAMKFKTLAAQWKISLDDKEINPPTDPASKNESGSGSDSKDVITTGNSVDEKSTANAPTGTPNITGMGNTPPPVTDSNSGVSSNFVKVADKGGTESGKMPSVNTAPSPVTYSGSDASATRDVRQAEVNQKQISDTAAIESILKESLNSHLRMEMLLKDISSKLDRGGMSIPNAVPDSRSDAKQVSGRPMPNEAISLRRSA